MSKMGQYVLEHQEQAAIRGEVDDPNDLQGGEQEEWEGWLDQQAEVSDDRRQNTDPR